MKLLSAATLLAITSLAEAKTRNLKKSKSTKSWPYTALAAAHAGAQQFSKENAFFLLKTEAQDENGNIVPYCLQPIQEKKGHNLEFLPCSDDTNVDGTIYSFQFDSLSQVKVFAFDPDTDSVPQSMDLCLTFYKKGSLSLKDCEPDDKIKKSIFTLLPSIEDNKVLFMAVARSKKGEKPKDDMLLKARRGKKGKGGKGGQKDKLWPRLIKTENEDGINVDVVANEKVKNHADDILLDVFVEFWITNDDSPSAMPSRSQSESPSESPSITKCFTAPIKAIPNSKNITFTVPFAEAQTDMPVEIKTFVRGDFGQHCVKGICQANENAKFYLKNETFNDRVYLGTNNGGEDCTDDFLEQSFLLDPTMFNSLMSEDGTISIEMIASDTVDVEATTSRNGKDMKTPLPCGRNDAYVQVNIDEHCGSIPPVCTSSPVVDWINDVTLNFNFTNLQQVSDPNLEIKLTGFRKGYGAARAYLINATSPDGIECVSSTMVEYQDTIFIPDECIEVGLIQTNQYGDNYIQPQDCSVEKKTEFKLDIEVFNDLIAMNNDNTLHVQAAYSRMVYTGAWQCNDIISSEDETNKLHMELTIEDSNNSNSSPEYSSQTETLDFPELLPNRVNITVPNSVISTTPVLVNIGLQGEFPTEEEWADFYFINPSDTAHRSFIGRISGEKYCTKDYPSPITDSQCNCLLDFKTQTFFVDAGTYNNFVMNGEVLVEMQVPTGGWKDASWDYNVDHRCHEYKVYVEINMNEECGEVSSAPSVSPSISASPTSTVTSPSPSTSFTNLCETEPVEITLGSHTRADMAHGLPVPEMPAWSKWLNPDKYDFYTCHDEESQQLDGSMPNTTIANDCACFSYDEDGMAHWFKFTANETKWVTASTCEMVSVDSLPYPSPRPRRGWSSRSIDTVINILQGVCTLEDEAYKFLMGSSTCVAGNDDNYDANCEYGSSVSFLAREGETYLILVDGYFVEEDGKPWEHYFELALY